jgi:isopentenyl diphosphate isomerase/L-lactate dehydrogenase-like FMN-dependent dehydrogenase
MAARATLYGTACGGQAGAARAIKILSDELERSFGYVGARRVSEIGPHIFAHRDPGMPGLVQMSVVPVTTREHA